MKSGQINNFNTAQNVFPESVLKKISNSLDLVDLLESVCLGELHRSTAGRGQDTTTRSSSLPLNGILLNLRMIRANLSSIDMDDVLHSAGSFDDRRTSQFDADLADNLEMRNVSSKAAINSNRDITRGESDGRERPSGEALNGGVARSNRQPTVGQSANVQNGRAGNGIAARVQMAPTTTNGAIPNGGGANNRTLNGDATYSRAGANGELGRGSNKEQKQPVGRTRELANFLAEDDDEIDQVFVPKK